MAVTSSAAAAPVIEIAPSKGGVLELRELWSYRELLWLLVTRDVKVRYKQTILGVSWAVIQPLTATIIFSVVFGRLAKLPSNGIPYPLFSFAGLLVWNFVAAGVARAATSLVSSANLVTKVYFPRVLVPLAAAMSGALDALVSCAVLAGFMVHYAVSPTAAIFALPLFAALALMTTLGVGLWLGALNARYRDVGHVTPFLLQIWLYASPVAYSTQLVPDRWRLLYAFNPMTGVVDGFRWALVGGGAEMVSSVWPSALSALLILVSGVVYFRRHSRTVADVI